MRYIEKLYENGESFMDGIGVFLMYLIMSPIFIPIGILMLIQLIAGAVVSACRALRDRYAREKDELDKKMNNLNCEGR